MPDIDEISVEEVELHLRKAARGDIPHSGDVLMRGDRGWRFSKLALQDIADGRFDDIPNQTIPANGTISFTVGVPGSGADVETEAVLGVRPAAFVLVSPPTNFNPALYINATAGNQAFRMFITNTMNMPNDLYENGDPPEGLYGFIALQLTI